MIDPADHDCDYPVSEDDVLDDADLGADAGLPAPGRETYDREQAIAGHGHVCGYPVCRDARPLRVGQLCIGGGEALTIRQVGTLDEALPCGCIPYEHEQFGPCDDLAP